MTTTLDHPNGCTCPHCLVRQLQLCDELEADLPRDAQNAHLLEFVRRRRIAASRLLAIRIGEGT